MHVSKQLVVSQMTDYMNDVLTKEELIRWCEGAFQEGTFEDDVVKEIIVRIGLMDARNFEISYKDLTLMLARLGRKLRVEVV